MPKKRGLFKKILTKLAKKKTKRRTIRAKSKKRKIKRSQKKRGVKKRVIKKKTSIYPKEQLIGEITHYFPHVKAGVLKVKKGTLKIGDNIHIKGHTTDLTQKVTSMQINRVPITIAPKNKEIGLLVKSRVRHNDLVYKLK